MADKKKPTAEELRKRVTTGRMPPPAAAPPQQPTRVTGKVPQAAQLPPGTRGNPPLPVGTPVTVSKGVRQPVSMTDLEKRVLHQIGWREGDPLPANMADILSKYKKELMEAGEMARYEATHDLPLPVPPGTPPIKQETIDIAQLPPDKRAEIQSAVKQMVQQEKDRIEQQKAVERVSRLSPEVQQALAQAETASMRHRNPNVPPQPGDDVEVDLSDVDDLHAYDKIQAKLPESEKLTPEKERRLRAQALEKAQASAQPKSRGINLGGKKPEVTQEMPKSIPAQMDDQIKDMMREDGIEVDEPVETPTPEEFEQAQDEPAEDFGATHVLAECPHCGWQLDREDIPEPPYHEKMSFLHSVLGQKSFIKRYDLFDGAVKVVFRTLTTQEMDAIFATCMAERQLGLITNQLEFWEKANRLRTYLQLQAMESELFQHNLPDGLSRDTNPIAECCWDDPDLHMPEREGPGDHGIKHIEKWLLDNVLKTEVINTLVNVECNRFNRLVAKLEAMVDNSDFWRATGEQS